MILQVAGLSQVDFHVGQGGRSLAGSWELTWLELWTRVPLLASTRPLHMLWASRSGWVGSKKEHPREQAPSTASHTTLADVPKPKPITCPSPEPTGEDTAQGGENQKRGSLGAQSWRSSTHSFDEDVPINEASG